MAQTAPASRPKRGAVRAARAGSATPAVGALAPTLRILETRVLRGPNYWAREPVIRMLVDLGVLEQYPSNKIPNFTDALVALLPTLEDHACSLGRRGGFLTRLRDGTWAGHIAEHVALEFQNLAGTDVRHGKTRSAGKTGQYNCIYEYREEQVGLEAGKMAVALVNHLVAPDDPTVFFDFAPELERLIRLAERQAFGPSTQALIDEAVSRDIPFIRLDRHSLVQFGHGVHQQRIRATMTSRTSAIGVDIASDKSLTNRLLDSAGLPVPRSEVVTTEEDTVAAALRLGFPCVVKPLDGNHGRGVHLDLRSDAAVRAAFHGARAESRSGDLVVESYVAGNDYRCLVIGGKVAAIAERVPASVTGDGEHTVRQLVDIANQDPRRGIGHEKVLTRIKLDESAEALVRAQGSELDGVPPAGTWIKLALTGNMSTGGTSIDRTIEAHPDNVEIAETAARIIGLDVAGIDFICPDIATPVRETGGAIVEVNAAPGFRMHTHPTEGEPQYVARPVIDSLFPSGSPARIPIIAVTGTNGKTTTVRMIAHILKLMGRRVGMTSTDGIVVDNRLIKRGDMSGPKSAMTVLQNPTVDTAVFEVARGGILREGLGYDRNDVAVVTNVAGDHLGLGGITIARPARERQGRRRGGRAAVGDRGPQRGRLARVPDGPSLRRPGRAVQHVDDEGRGRLRPRRRPHRARRGGVLPGAVGRGRAHRAQAGAAHDAGAVHPPHPRDVRRPGADERRERARGGGRGLVGRGPPARHPPGPADVHDVVLPGARPAQPARRRRRSGRDRLLPQRRRHAPAGRFRRADDERAGHQGRAPRHGEVGRPGPAARSVSWASPATGGTRTRRRTGASPRPHSTRSSSARTRTCAGARPARRPRTSSRASARRRPMARAGSTRAEKVLDEMTAVRMALRRAIPGDLVVCCVDDAIGVYREAMAATGTSRGGTAFADPGELEAPEG